MCGIGKRFSDAGFMEHKSMLKIDGQNMLERILKKFDNINIFLITTNSILKHLKKNQKWNFIKNKFNLVIIDNHKLGPAYSIYKAFDLIPKEVGTYISYCDIIWQWDKEFHLHENIDAGIFCHYGFHPHLVNNNFSAFCKPSSKNINKLSEIREKKSYTNDWMKEPLSIGLFYINDFEKLRIPLDEMISSNKKVANEFFPSLLFNYLLKKNIEVDLIPVESFVHYGAPLQFNDINFWADYIKYSKLDSQFKNSRHKKYQATIMISGKGSRMRKISNDPKYLMKAGKYTLLEHVFNSLPLDKKDMTLITNENKKNNFSEEFNYWKIKKTSSQFDSLKLSLEHLKKQENFFLCSCDCFGFFDNEKFDNLVNSQKSEVIIFGFKPSLMQMQLKSSFSTFNFKNEMVNKINIKSTSRNNYFGLAGFFWFRKGSTLATSIKQFELENNELDREIIIDDIIEFMRLQKIKIAFISLDKYIHLGTPEEYNEFNYWNLKIPQLL